MSDIATLERPRASAPVVAPATWRAEDIGIRIGRVVIKSNESLGGSSINRITLSAGIWPAETERKEQCQAA
jgi:hypothetical protein